MAKESDFGDYFEEQMKDPEFRKEYKKILAEEKAKNETQKAEEEQIKQFSIAEIWGTLDQNQLYLLSWVAHTSMQKGRIMGKMEMDGHTAKEIADTLHTEEELVQKALDEDPYDVIA